MRKRLLQMVNSKVSGTICLFALLCVIGCGEFSSDELSDSSADSECPVAFDVTFGNETRAVTDNIRDRFAFYAYTGRTAKAKNVTYTKQEDGSWTGALVTWPANDGAMNIFGLAPDYSQVQNLKMTYNKHYFDYTLPNGNFPDFWYASNIGVRASKSNGVIKMTFVAGFAYFTASCKQNTTKLPAEDYTVIVKSIKLHNLTSRGLFTFLETGSNKVSWTPYTEDEDYIAYEQVFSTPVTLTGSYTTITDSAIVAIPQTITKWGTTATNAVTTAYADANHQCYVELECQVIDSEGNYKWGSEDGTGTYPMYESVYIPFPSTKAYTINSRNSFRINFDGGFDRDGNPTVFHTEKKTHLDIDVEDWIEVESEQGQGFEVEF